MQNILNVWVYIQGLHDLVRNTLLEGVRNILLENARKILMENVRKQS